MSHKRRQVLKAAGAVGVGAVATVGSASATCEETVDDVTISGEGPLLNGVLVAANEELEQDRTYTDAFSTEAFAGTDLPDRRMSVTCTWNESVEDGGQSAVELTLQHNFRGSWDAIAQEVGSGFGSDNRIEFEVADGEFYDAEAVDAPATVADGEEYRFRVRDGYIDTAPVLDFQIDVEFQAFDSSC